MAGLVGASAGTSELSIAAFMAQITQSAKKTVVEPQPVEAPRSYYVSPHTVIDAANSKAILVLRDSATGDIQVQVPATVNIEKALASEQRLRDALSAGITKLDLPDFALEDVLSTQVASEAPPEVQVSVPAVSVPSTAVTAQNFSAQVAVPDARATVANFVSQAAQPVAQSSTVLVDA